MKNSMKMIALSVVASTLFVGCGGGSNSDSPAEATVSTGTFVDAPVQGLSFKTPTQDGYTDANGHFKYVAGEDVEFKLGNLFLGIGKAGGLVTPYTISDNDNTATNIALLLQNFDNDRTDDILNILALKDYNLSDFNLSDTSANLETKLTALLATGSFQTLRGGTDFGLLNSATVKSAMDSYLDANAIKYDKKFTQAYLDNTVFYKSSDEYPQYKNQFRNGSIYFAGDEDNGPGWDDTFSTASSTYTIVNGVINASYSSGDEVTAKIISITDLAVKVLETHLVHGSRTSVWYTSKDEAIKNTITVQYGFGTTWIENNTMYIPINDNGNKFVAAMTFKDGKRGLPDGSNIPYTINADGWTVVDERTIGNTYQVTKVTAVNGTRIDVITGEMTEVTNGTADTQVRFANLADAQAYLNTL